MDLNAFLNRIHCHEEIDTSLSSLANLQKAFLSSVPFENLNIHAGIKLDFSEAAVFDKIIKHRRGGVCYENNAVFYDALTALGFTTKMIAAEMFPSTQASGKYDHMALVVHILGKDYLVDVGNGRYFGDPVPLSGDYQVQGEDAFYKVMSFDDEHLGLYLNAGNSWEVRYIFTTEAKAREDFLDACHYTETSPDSHFTQAKIVSMLTPEGRITLSDRDDDSMKIIRTGLDGTVNKQEVTPEQYQSLLAHEFGL